MGILDYWIARNFGGGGLLKRLLKRPLAYEPSDVRTFLVVQQPLITPLNLGLYSGSNNVNNPQSTRVEGGTRGIRFRVMVAMNVPVIP